MNRRRTDDAVTLVELMVAMSIFAILLAITFPVINTFYNLDSSFTNTTSSINQILPATTVIARYIRSAVSPAPQAGGVNVPIFSPSGSTFNFNDASNSMQFYSNTGAAGPTLVTIATTPNSIGGTYTLTVSSQAADTNTCPPYGTKCTYSSSPKIDFAITDVQNGSRSSSPPLFQYSSETSATGYPVFYNSSNVPSGWTCPYPNSSPTACFPTTAQAIQSLTGIELTVDSAKRNGNITGFTTFVIPYSPSYSATVG